MTRRRNFGGKTLDNFLKNPSVLRDIFNGKLDIVVEITLEPGTTTNVKHPLITPYSFLWMMPETDTAAEVLNGMYFEVGDREVDIHYEDNNYTDLHYRMLVVG